MELDFVLASMINLLINLSYTVIALLVAIMVLMFIDRYFLKELDIQVELKKNNLAVAIFSASVMLFVALIICFGLKS